MSKKTRKAHGKRMTLQALLKHQVSVLGLQQRQGENLLGLAERAFLGERFKDLSHMYKWIERRFVVNRMPVKVQPPKTKRVKIDDGLTYERRAWIWSPAFYRSEEWRIVRFQALKDSRGCCDLCGRSQRDHGVVLHVDHIRPRSKFPELALCLANLQILCEDCNLGKGNRDDTDWRPKERTEAENVIDLTDWRQF